MISEIDIKDWERIDIEKAKEHVRELWPNINGQIYNNLMDVLTKLEDLRYKQIRAVQKQTAALLREK